MPSRTAFVFLGGLLAVATAQAAEEGLLPPPNGWPTRPQTGKLKLEVEGLDHPNAFFLAGVPNNYTPRKSWPLMIILHGGPGGRPDDLCSVFRGGLMEQGVICVFPKALQEQLLEWNYPHSSAYLLQIIRQMASQYRIDPKRLYLAGHSMGGGGTWVNAAVLRELWAAVGPMSGWYKPSNHPPTEWLKGVPIFCMHGKKDRAVPAVLSRQAFKDLKQLGCKTRIYEQFCDPARFDDALCVYREIQEAGHAVFDPWKKRGAKEVGAMVAWMLAHKRETPANMQAAERRLAMFGGKRFAWRGGPRLGTYDGQPALPSAEDVKAQKLGLKLRKQFRKKDYNGAAKTCEEMLKLQPKNAGHYYNLACCRARQGKKREALLALQHAIKNGWDDAEHMQKDPDLASLRRDPNFIRLLQYVKQQGKRR